jgi:hypothetical protein
MKMQNTDVVARLRSLDPYRRHTVCIDDLSERSPPWTGYERLKQLQAPAQGFDSQGPTLLSIFEKAQGKPQGFGSQAHRQPSIMLLREGNASAARCMGHDLQERLGGDRDLALEWFVVGEDQEDGRSDAGGKNREADRRSEPIVAVNDRDREKRAGGLQ